MKRVITCYTSIQPFNLTTTGMSYYDGFLNEADLEYMQKSKNRTGEVVEMSPKEYFEECSSHIFENASVDSLKKQRLASKDADGQRLVYKYADMMMDGTKFPMCVLNYADNTQEGLHRMMAAGDEFGWNKKYPVLCIKVFDQEREDRNNKYKEMRDFEKYDLEKCCEEARDNLSDWDKPAPDNIADIFANEIVKIAKEEYNHDIEVEVSIYTNDEGYHRLNCELVTFDNMENPYPNNVSNIWIEDMFKTEDEQDDSSLDLDDIELDEDDLDISSFLLK